MNELQPLHTLRVIGDLPLSARHKAVLWALLIFADKEGKCWPSHATLAAKAGLSRSTVKVTLIELVALGHITKTNRRLAGRLEADSNLYILHVASERASPDAAHPGPLHDLGVGRDTTDPGQPPPHPGPVHTPEVGRDATHGSQPAAHPGPALDQEVSRDATDRGPEVDQELPMELPNGTVHGTGRGRVNAPGRETRPPGPTEHKPGTDRIDGTVPWQLQRLRPATPWTQTGLHAMDSAEGAPAGPRGRGTRIPEHWKPRPETLERFRTRERVDAIASLERFRNHFLASSGPHAIKRDWERAFVNWVLRDCEENRAKPIDGECVPPGVPSPPGSPAPEGQPIATGDDLAELARQAARAANGARARMASRILTVERRVASDVR